MEQPTPQPELPQVPSDEKADEKADVLALLQRAERASFFGPSFFLRHLGNFVRDRCPQSDEHLPIVHIHMMGGEAFEVCHIIGVGPSWVALAVRDGDAMRTELVPYPCIVRVTIRAALASAQQIGFAAAHAPRVFSDPDATQTPAQLLARAAAPPAADG